VNFYHSAFFLIASVLVLLTLILFIFPVILLGFVQLRNFCVGKTTHERYARRSMSKTADHTTGIKTSYINNEEDFSLTVDSKLLEEEGDSEGAANKSAGKQASPS
jgi:hypothetical protein